MEEKPHIAFEVDASAELTGAEVVKRAAAAGASFVVVTAAGTTIGVLSLDQLDDRAVAVVDVARNTPEIVERTVEVGLGDGRTVHLEVEVQGGELATWELGDHRHVLALGGRQLGEALRSPLMAFAMSDVELPGPGGEPERQVHRYVCSKGHEEDRASDDPDRTCKECEEPLSRK